VAASHDQQAMPSASLYSVAAERLAEKYDVLCIRLSALETQCVPPHRAKQFTWRNVSDHPRCDAADGAADILVALKWVGSHRRCAPRRRRAAAVCADWPRLGPLFSAPG
jgi:hypothetical protein